MTAVRIARFQVRRLLSQMKWWTVAGVGVLLGLYEASTVAAVPHINQWDVVWLGWNSLLIATLVLWPLFMYIVLEVVLRDQETAYTPLMLLRVHARVTLWMGTVLALGATALIYVVSVTLLMVIGAAAFVPFRWSWVAPPGPPAHGQLLFGNGVGVYPFLEAHALWGHPPLLAIGVIWGLATLTLWAMSVALVAVTLRSRTVSLPLVLAIVLSGIGSTLIYSLPPGLFPTTQMVAFYHAPYWMQYAVSHGRLVRVVPFYQTFGWTGIYMGGVGVISTLAGARTFHRQDLAHDAVRG